MIAVEPSVAGAPAQSRGGSARVAALRETYRAELGCEDALEALDYVLGSIGALRAEPPAEAMVEALLYDLEFLADHLGRIGSFLSPCLVWPGDDVLVERGTALSESIARLAEPGRAALALAPRGVGGASAGLRETFAIRFTEPGGSGPLGRRHLELVVAQVSAAVAGAKIARPRPARQSPVVRDLAAAEAELRYLADLARRLAASPSGVGRPDEPGPWREIVRCLPAQLESLAEQARKAVRHG